MQLAATITQFTFASDILPARSLQIAAYSKESLIRGVLIKRAASSSSASFRSFHFDEESAVWKPEGISAIMSVSSAKFLGSRSSGDAGDSVNCSKGH